MALATPLRALTGVAVTANPSSTSDGAGDNSNPYAIIIDRNVFRLNPPPPPPSSADKKPVDLPKVYLNGIIKIGDDVRVLFSIPPKDAKGQTSYFKLAPGERDDVLELVKIHPDQQEVDVLVSGTAMTLSMLSNSLASAGGKAAGGATAPGPAAVLHGGPPAPAAAATPGGSSAIITGGGGRNSSPYGGVTVAGGGGGVTTIGGGNSTSFGGGFGGVSVAGGGGNSFGGGGVGSTSYGGGGTSFGGGVSVSGGASAQLANTLFSGTQVSSQAANIPTVPALPPDQQALAMAAYYETHGGSSETGDTGGKTSAAPPLPPPVMALINGSSGSSPPSPPKLPPMPPGR